MPDIVKILDDLRPWGEALKPFLRYGGEWAISAAKRFFRHYEDDPPETQQQASENVKDTATRIRREIDDRVGSGQITEDQARSALLRPDIAKHVQDALLAASETSDATLHDELAKLVGARLVAPQESRLNNLLRMACDQLPYLNARQLRMLGLVFAVLHIQPDPPNLSISDERGIDTAYEVYLRNLADTLEPFQDLAGPKSVDFMHFEELGLAKLSSWTSWMGLHTNNDVSQSTLLAPMSADFYVKAMATLDAQVKPNVTVQWINRLMEGNHEHDQFGFKAVKLTPVGYLLGYCMYCIAHGKRFDPSTGWGEDDQKPPKPRWTDYRS